MQGRVRGGAIGATIGVGAVAGAQHAAGTTSSALTTSVPHAPRFTPMPSLQTLANTLWSWRDPIARMWRFTKSNAITEGLHNKMEVISRRAYGFRNFHNYRLRVRALCG
jgi:transposase